MIPKTLGKNKTSVVYKPKTIFNKNNCPITVSYTHLLRQIPRTENNPHGLIITDWKTILNKDLDLSLIHI